MLVDRLAVLWSLCQITLELVAKTFQVLDEIRVAITPNWFPEIDAILPG